MAWRSGVGPDPPGVRFAGGVLGPAPTAGAGTTRAQSALFGDRYKRPADLAVLDALDKVADARGESTAQVAIAWLLSKPAVTAPILGVTVEART